MGTQDNTTTTTTVAHTMTLEVIDDERLDGASIDAEFVYTVEDPYAVTVVFDAAQGPICWRFGRDLLHDGVYDPSGDGDVHVWPCLGMDGAAVVQIDLCSPEGMVLLQASTRAITEFLRETYLLVAAGRESAHLDLDEELRAFFEADAA